MTVFGEIILSKVEYMLEQLQRNLDDTPSSAILALCCASDVYENVDAGGKPLKGVISEMVEHFAHALKQYVLVPSNSLVICRGIRQTLRQLASHSDTVPTKAFDAMILVNCHITSSDENKRQKLEYAIDHFIAALKKYIDMEA